MTRAKGIAGECQALARLLSDRQNAAETKLTPTQITRIVNALSNAGNALDALDRIDVMGPAPVGFTRTQTYTADGRLVVTFEEIPSPKPPTTED